MSETKPIEFKRQKGKNKPKGRIVSESNRVQVAQWIGTASIAKDNLIENLHCLQDAHGYLDAGHLAALAELMNLSMAAVYEVATFYHHFDVVRENETPPASITVRICDSLSCEMAGANELLNTLKSQHGDNIRIKTAPCVGRCACAPVAVVGQNAIENATVDSVNTAIDNKQTRAVVPAVQTLQDYKQQGGYSIYQACLNGEHTVDNIIDEISQSGLRGLGGAGFPVGRKWQIVRQQQGDKILAVNIDEGEPGTFKDRYYLEQKPHQFIEGALISAWVVGAKQIYIYLRDEYHGCRQALEHELSLLCDNASFASPNIILRRGAGAYICGEESSMIESIEGKRGEPRLRPPYVAEIGVFNRPTLEHNMETLHWIPEILQKGKAFFTQAGRNGRKGLRSFSVSGRVANPGVHLAPAGITIKELIDEYCGGMLLGHQFYAYLPGGASGGILPASANDVPLDFDTIQQFDSNCFIGSAAIIVLSDKDTAKSAAINMMRFFADESCGQCTPCRVGTEKASQLMEAAVWDISLLEDLSRAMQDASICGLGQAAPNPIRCVVKHFPHEISKTT